MRNRWDLKALTGGESPLRRAAARNLARPPRSERPSVFRLLHPAEGATVPILRAAEYRMAVQERAARDGEREQH